MIFSKTSKILKEKALFTVFSVIGIVKNQVSLPLPYF